MKKALIVVDLQNDFLPGGALAVKTGNEIIPLINKTQTFFDIVIATQDWHPKNHVSFAKNHHLKKGDIINVGGNQQILWPVHCVENSWGAEFAKDFDTKHVKKIFHKGVDPMIDSYSTFFDNERKRDTGLDAYLREKKVQDVYFAGLATEYCVFYSAIHAKELGYNVFVMLDACRGIELHPGDIENAIVGMKKIGVKIINTSEIN